MATSQQLMSGQARLLKRSRLRADVCLEKHQYGLTLAHLCVVFQLDPSLKDELKSKLLFALEKHSKMLQDRKCWKELFQCYEQVLEVFPECEDVHYKLGTLLYRSGYTFKAACCFQKAWTLKPGYTLARLSLENLKTELLQRWHFLMLNDRKRNEAFAKAICEAVKAGYSNVLDVGAGTGILSMFAVKAGADQVIACEMSEALCVTAADVLKANHMDKRVKVINKHSTEMLIPKDLPERVSLLVTETFDAGLFGERILLTLQHAWQNLLLSPKVSTDETEKTTSSLSKDDFSQLGFVIPSKAKVWAALVECEWIRKNSSNVESLGPVDVHKIFTRKKNKEEPYDSERLNTVRGGFQYLSNPFQVIEVDFNNPTEIERLLCGVETKQCVKCVKSGQLDAVVMWFVLTLYRDISLSSSPDSGSCWEQAVFPVSPSDVDSRDIEEGSSVVVSAVCHEYLQLYCSQVLPPVKQETSFVQPLNNRLDSLISARETKAQKHLTDPNQQKNLNVNMTKPLNMDRLNKPTIEVNSEVLRLLNDNITNTLQFEIISDMARQGALGTLIDMCNFPYVGLVAAKLGARRVMLTCVKEKCTVIRLAKILDIPLDKLLFTSVEHLHSQSVHPDVFISNIVEMSGLPNFQVLHNIAILRFSCLSSATVLLPCKIHVYCSVIESWELMEQAKVAGDERTLGLKISQFINTFTTRIHQDVDLHTLHHTRLTDDLLLFDIHLGQVEPNLAGEHKVTVTSPGMVHAIPFWFSLEYPNGQHVWTSDIRTHWLQSACIVQEEKQVTRGEILHVCYSWSRGDFDLWIT